MQLSLLLQNVQLNFSSKNTISKEQQDTQDMKDWAHLLQVSSKVVFTAQNLGSFKSQGLSSPQDPLSRMFSLPLVVQCVEGQHLLMLSSQTQRAGWMHHWSHICVTDACEMLNLPNLPEKQAGEENMVGVWIITA